MSRCIWVTITFRGGRTEKYCVAGRVGKRCYHATFLSMSPGEPDADLDELTRAVNSTIEAFLDQHPGQNLRILADTQEDGDEADQLRFAFVGTDLEILLPEPD